MTSHNNELQSEAIYVIRESAAQFEKPVLLFSGGKDSICLANLARKAFSPGIIPFPFLHIDTGNNFPETLEFRDRYIASIGGTLIVRTVEESIASGRVADEKGPGAGRADDRRSEAAMEDRRDRAEQPAPAGCSRGEEGRRAKREDRKKQGYF